VAVPPLGGASSPGSRRYLLANHLPLIPLAKRPLGAVLLFREANARPGTTTQAGR